MFTGLVTDIGEIVAVSEVAQGLRRLRIGCGYPRASIAEGASIACAGVCLTVVGTGEEGGRTWFAADAAAETLRLTTVGRWRAGSGSTSSAHCGWGTSWAGIWSPGTWTAWRR